MQTSQPPLQNTKEWLEWRKDGIGASDMNVIMGTAKMTIKELYEDKLDLNPEAREERKKKLEFIGGKGHKLEVIGRARFELENFCEIPAIAAIHNLFPYMRASLDGFWEEENAVWECKYVGEKDFQLVESGKVLPQYVPQLNHQLYVTGAKKVILYVLTEEKDENGKQIKGEYKTASVEFFPVQEDIEAQNKKAFAFWDSITKKTPPELSPDDTFELKASDTVAKDLKDYAKLKKKHETKLAKAMETKTMKDIKELEDECKALEKKIFAELPHNRCHFKGIKVLESSTTSTKWKGAYEELLQAVKKGNDELPRNCKIEIPSLDSHTSNGTKKTITLPKEEKAGAKNA